MRRLLALVIVLTLWAVPCHAAIALVAHTSEDLTAGSTTAAINTTGANLLIVSLSCYTNCATLSDSKTNTWILINSCDYFGTATLKLYYAKNAVVGSGHTFTAGTNASALSIAAFSGADTTAPLDQNSCAVDTAAATVQPGSITPGATNTLVYSGMYYESSTVSGINSGFTFLDAAVGGSGTGGAYLLETSIVATNPTWTVGASNTRIAANQASFLAASAGGARSSNRMLLGVD